MNHMTLPMGSADISIFQRKPATFVKSRNTDMQSFLQVVSNSFNLFLFFESSKVVLISMVAILMMSQNLANLGLLKLKVFWNKGYNVITFVHRVTNKVLSCDSSHILDLVMRPKFGNYNIPWRQVMITTIL